MTDAHASFYVTGGTLRHDARCYVERRADRELFEGLARSEFCYVLTSRQMGKSSLMVHTATRLRQAGVTVAAIDLTGIGQNLTAEQWYHGLLDRVARQIDREDELEEFWDAHTDLGPLQRWLEALRLALRTLPASEARLTEPAGAGAAKGRTVTAAPAPLSLVIFVDEIDTVRSLPFPTDEFFGAIRECYNRRAADSEFNRLTFCLLGVATPADLIRNPHVAPFNVGRRIELTDFSDQEGLGLAQGFGQDEKVAGRLLRRVLYWTGGHPYLTQVLCRAVASEAVLAGPAGVDRLCERLFLSEKARERDDNLTFVREYLLRSQMDQGKLLGVYSRVLAGDPVAEDPGDPFVTRLRLAGIVSVLEGFLHVRNRIYHRVFNTQWVTANLPGETERQQRLARRQKWLRLATVSALALLVSLAVIGLGQLVLKSKYGAALVAPPVQPKKKQIDLAPYHNAALERSWLPGGPGNDLTSLRKEGKWLVTTKFEVGGVLQLAGRPEGEGDLPASVSLKLERDFQVLHILQATRGAAAEGTRVASLGLTYANGWKLEIPVIYGVDVRDWWVRTNEPAGPAKPKVAWTGTNAAATTNKTTLRLFDTTYNNPIPSWRVASLSYTSALAGVAPFLVAVTVE